MARVRALGLLASCVVALGAAAPAFAQSHHHGGFGAPAGGWSHGGPGASGRGFGAPTGGWNRGAPGMSGRGGEAGRQGGAGAWDARRYNGYWAGGRWYYGAPAHPAYQTPGFRPGYAPFRRGAVLPPSYQAYVLDNYWQYHLRRPPYGYNWVQVGNQFLLVSSSTGLIFDVVSGF